MIGFIYKQDIKYCPLFVATPKKSFKTKERNVHAKNLRYLQLETSMLARLTPERYEEHLTWTVRWRSSRHCRISPNMAKTYGYVPSTCVIRIMQIYCLWRRARYSSLIRHSWVIEYIFFSKMSQNNKCVCWLVICLPLSLPERRSELILQSRVIGHVWNTKPSTIPLSIDHKNLYM